MILKFFLNVSKKAQRERFLERLDKPEKNWKFSLADAQERKHWKAYQDAYEDAIRSDGHQVRAVVRGARPTRSGSRASWWPAALYEALAKLRLRYPDVGPEKKKELAAARAELVGESGAVVRAQQAPGRARRRNASVAKWRRRPPARSRRARRRGSGVDRRR